ncbi:uncharacterized protein LOC100569543 [Acyrthosiphon pisum]|uniref:ACYPI008667 protein n=1 Tax=Acyrthosiphon pisum TaxID=7029 RepID=A0A8R2JT80_ACYPI|nr:uncharacterized protein LOC100569543 [Acyrthosiphon pisum]|eukprot:XP_003244691.1 PREDICTED: uncharacterized protein LOC100569543 [Acyrthosiphon pisum]
MFLSYAAVAVFAFAILLNVFYLYLPVESAGTGFMYPLCEDCLNSECHAKCQRPCITRWDPEYNFTCYTCDPQDGNQQFYSEDECKKGCTDPTKMCICDASCYMCIVKEGTDMSKYMNCTVPEQEEQPTCV